MHRRILITNTGAFETCMSCRLLKECGEGEENNVGLWAKLIILVSHFESAFFFLFNNVSSVAVLLQETYFSFHFLFHLSILLIGIGIK